MIRHIRDLLREAAAQRRPTISVEFFPPKTEEGERTLFEKTLPALVPAGFDYCSVTYGAGGSTRDKTLGIVERIQNHHRLTTLMHLTCVNATREQIESVVDEAHRRGVKNLLALRGDPPGGTGPFVKTAGGFEFSRELVAMLKQKNHFSIGTAGFPEGHIACKEGKHVDWGYLRDKVSAGADFVVTQLFFDNADFLEFRDHLSKKLKCDVPIVAGIFPVISRNGTKRFVELCGARLPAPFLSRLDALGDNDEAVTAFGIEYATKQCLDLIREGVRGLHIYGLNKTHSTVAIRKNLGSPRWPS